ncbi:uncharacterized protein LOC124488272 [Hypomesus transpacificus]|uniref:uncharacterized protein LOC124488272 n=1 Tax=Hypomesus transpacificus TaxID=137520 RepID=UPI001F07EB98|nr:uncharacterized protein LOC124488272 [Hypomesus transpacificus]
MYIVVEFTETKTVNIISDSWFEDGVTWWPNYKSDERINRAVQKREDPGPDWKQYDVRVLLRAGDYMKAKEKLRVSLICNTSELQTDDEEKVIMRKRKSKPRIIFGVTDSDSEADEGNKRRRTSTPLPPIPPPTLNVVCQTTTRPLPGQRHTTAPAPLVPSPPPYMLPSPPHHFSAGHRPDLRKQSDRGCDTAPMSLVDTLTRLPSSPVCRISATPLSENGQDHLFVPSFRLGKTGTGPVPCSGKIQCVKDGGAPCKLCLETCVEMGMPGP